MTLDIVKETIRGWLPSRFILGALALLVTTNLVTGWLWLNQRDKTTLVEAQNKDYIKFLDKLVEDNEKAEKEAADLRTRVAEYDVAKTNLEKKLRALKANDLSVKDYLDTRVPDPLRRLHRPDGID